MEPGTPEADQRRLLHFQTVGGGPTGVEFMAELHDWIHEDLLRQYPSLSPYVQMTLYDVAPRILGSFDLDLANYTTQRFHRAGVKVQTQAQVKHVDAHQVLINSTWVPYGVLVWATGVTQGPFIQKLGQQGGLAKCPKGTQRLLTDPWCRVLAPSSSFDPPKASVSSSSTSLVCVPNVYALGDCATIQDHDLPCTAQVASQKALYLANRFNSPDFTLPFIYKHRGSMAYVGGWKAVVDLPAKNYKVAGSFAWLLWRSVYLSKTVSWRNKFMIPWLWFMAWAFGRDACKLD
ncbi:hypothetical protein HMI55_004462 [Coelomomyces lativittatus]|nr:hypothetical protein HMI56_007711 [Coelomomyces lativittatus]KAJ1514682.1 hypothetical protein HMI55_004462 [Coelomomyces lativittatus]